MGAPKSGPGDVLFVFGGGLEVHPLDFLCNIGGGNYFQPASPREDMGQKVGRRVQADVEIGIVRLVGEELLGGVDGEVAHGEALFAEGAQDDVAGFGAVVHHDAEMLGEIALGIEKGVDGEGLVGEEEGQDAVEGEDGKASVHKARKEVPPPAEEFEAVGLDGPLPRGGGAVAMVGEDHTAAAAHGLDHGAEVVALAGDGLEEDAVVEVAGLADDVAHGEGAEHPLLDAVGGQKVGVVDKIAVGAVAAYQDAEHLLHLLPVTAEGGAAEGDAVAERGV